MIPFIYYKLTYSFGMCYNKVYFIFYIVKTQLDYLIDPSFQGV